MIETLAPLGIFAAIMAVAFWLEEKGVSVGLLVGVAVVLIGAIALAIEHPALGVGLFVGGIVGWAATRN